MKFDKRYKDTITKFYDIKEHKITFDEKKVYKVYITDIQKFKKGSVVYEFDPHKDATLVINAINIVNKGRIIK